MNGKKMTLLALGALVFSTAGAAEPVGRKAAPAIEKTMTLATLLGPGDFQVVKTADGWVEFRNVRTGATNRYRMGAGATLEGGRRIKVTAADCADGGGTGADLDCGSCKKECTIVATGSDPGPADDTVSCVCISPDGRSCRPK